MPLEFERAFLSTILLMWADPLIADLGGRGRARIAKIKENRVYAYG